MAVLLSTHFYGYFLLLPKPVVSDTLTSAKDTLSNSRLSYHAKISGIHSNGETRITIGTDGPDSDTDHLFPGDSILIGQGGNATKAVKTVLDKSHFLLNSALTASLRDDDPVISTQSAIHTITFTTATAVTNGLIKIRIPSATNNFNDGLPDQTGFDLNSITGSNISCPRDSGSLDFTAPTASSSGQNGCNSGYSCFECRFSGSLPALTAYTIIVGDASKKLINPIPASGHTQGIADRYSILVDIEDRYDNLIDTIIAKVALIESVLISATVDSTFSFSVAGQQSGESHCNQTTDVTTTYATVPFGSLSPFTFYDAAQTLTVSTNWDSGYLVTFEELDQLKVEGGSAEIPDSGADDNTATHVVKANWITTTATTSGAYGLGYSLANVSGKDAAFIYNQWQNYLTKQIPCTGTAETCGNQDTAQVIMSSFGRVSTSQIDVCYRIKIPDIQEAGYYNNKVMYTATPIF